MNITIIGAGYVGLVTAACLAKLGNKVTCLDVNEDRINNLKFGILPIYEPGLGELIAETTSLRQLSFAKSLSELKQPADIIFIAVGTPCDKAGFIDMSYILQAAHDIGTHISEYCVIVDKSTVPVGAAEQVYSIIEKELEIRQLHIDFDIVSNPEFLREGSAIKDFMEPERIILGLVSDKAKAIMLKIFAPLISAENIYYMSIRDAEMTKYVANAMLAARISFMNEVANICEYYAVNIDQVRKGIGSDSRIGPSFLSSGCGYGGSCFPKDIRTLINMAKSFGFNPLLLQAVEARNNQQREILVNKVLEEFGDDLSHITIGIWGLSFKPDTDDIREAPSLTIIEKLIKHQATIKVYDPVAMPQAKHYFLSVGMISDRLLFTENKYAAVEGADALVLVTEWEDFLNPNLTTLKNIMNQYIIFDGRNQFDADLLSKSGFSYFSIGRYNTNTIPASNETL